MAKRYPATHSFLKWAGPALVLFLAGCLGLIATFADVFDGVKNWAERWYLALEPTMTAPWFVALSVVLIISYIAALIWTGQEPTAERDPAPAPALNERSRESSRIAPAGSGRKAAPAHDATESLREKTLRVGLELQEALSRAVMGDSSLRPRKRTFTEFVLGTHPEVEQLRAVQDVADKIRDGVNYSPRKSSVDAIWEAKQRSNLEAALSRPETWMPLDEAIRYLAKDSQWGADQNPNDPGFSVRVAIEMRDALACGDLIARGRWFHLLKGGVQDPPLHVLKPIPEEYWGGVQIDAYRALHREGRRLGSQLVENVVQSGDHEGMHDIQLSKRQVEARWPRSDQSLFSEAWNEDAKDRIPFVRIRDLAPGYGIKLAHPDPGASNVAYALEGELVQAAVDERLKVWGRKYRKVPSNQPLVPIPASHFEDFEFGHGCLHYECENKHSHTGKMGKRVEDFPDEAYFDLHLSFKDTCAVLKAFAENQP